MTGKIITNVKAKYGEASEVDGFEDLRPEDQDRIIKALEAGKVAEEDIPDSAKKAEDDEEEPKKAKRAPKKKAEDGETEEKPKKARATSSKVSLLSCVVRISR